ncbi:Clavaminate synthase-like protein [Paxillus ammoniavirescens]|nr:Clavaminate synthase-like protein [Paxillus ammoniavirescens]
MPHQHSQHHPSFLIVIFVRVAIPFCFVSLGAVESRPLAWVGDSSYPSFGLAQSHLDLTWIASQSLRFKLDNRTNQTPRWHCRRPSRYYLKIDNQQLTVPTLNASFPHQWLRDSCQCPSCVPPSTQQKLHRSSDIPADIRPAPGGLTATTDGVHVRWVDGHESFHSFPFLKFHRDAEQIPWNALSISQAEALYIPYKDLTTPSGLLSAITQLTQFGLLFVTGVPNEQTSDETCEVRKLVSIFGEIRSTFYGELWDVKTRRNSRNIAYTDLDLGLHMDLVYFQHPPRYQILHCVRNRVVGGSSVFADGLHVASMLRKSHPMDFDVLTTTLTHPAPNTSTSSTLPIKHLKYSPPFQAPLATSTPPSFYTALGKFSALLDDPANRMEYTLREGDAVLFDNHRVLHARTAFTDAGEGKEGETNPDTIPDRGRVLRANLDGAD